MSGLHTLWQIAVPPHMRDHSHMESMRLFVARFTEYAQGMGDVVFHFPWVEIPSTPKAITLNFHTHGFSPNTYHFKESFLKDWVQIDSHGYSGWHSSNLRPGLMPVAQGRLDRMADKFARYMASSQSKYEQATGSQPFDFPFIFFPLQKPQDETSLFARYTPQEIVAAALPWCRMTGHKLVIKRHPYCHSEMIADWLQELSRDPQVCVTDDNVVKILEKAQAVLTVNSSVGFEALMRGIPVFSFGASEYGYMTHQMTVLDDLGPALSAIIGAARKIPADLYAFAAAHLYDLHDPMDFWSLYEALSQSSSKMLSPPAITHAIDFSEKGNGSRHLLHGFSYPETWGVRTNANKATMVFDNKTDKQQTLEATVYMGGYTEQGYPHQYYEILWNGRLVGQPAPVSYEGSRDPLFIKLYLNSGLNTLSFVMHNSIRPAERQDFFDVRQLGLSFEKIEILEVT